MAVWFGKVPDIITVSTWSDMYAIFMLYKWRNSWWKVFYEQLFMKMFTWKIKF